MFATRAMGPLAAAAMMLAFTGTACAQDASADEKDSSAEFDNTKPLLPVAPPPPIALVPDSAELPETSAQAADQKLYRIALNLARSECDADDGKSCALGGEILYYGYGEVEKDVEATIPLFEKGCALEYLSACNLLAIAQYDTDKSEESHAASTQLLFDTCDKGYGYACSNAGFRSENGIGVPLDKARARGMYIKACDVGYGGGCLNAATAFANAIGGPKNEKRSYEFYGRACDLESLEGCFWKAYYEERGRAGLMPNAKGSAAQYDALCDKAHAQACAALGWMLQKGKGRGIKKDRDRARKLYLRACTLGSANSCNNLGIMHEYGEGGPTNYKAAVLLFERGCEAGGAGACNSMARMHTNGKGVARSLGAAAAYRERACELGWERACK
ncbi:MAG: tetratricopeptide repeat protein [Pseudomonadota bacterium]